ncbi:acylphosphatase [Halalkalibacter sp. AB-rgal2]|uniref:acylphosphatase n=1 Tax=Halalkalibacter sp. AB-rgal2 TaxID=3242695 RepID=UPI00359D44E1
MSEDRKAEWLPHLPVEVVEDARGPEFDAYLIALEGWRRGLTLKWHVKDSEKFKEMKTWFDDKPGKLFSLSSEKKTHYFFRTRGDKVSNEAVEIGANKERTKEALQRRNINFPKGKVFSSETSEGIILEYIEVINFPVVVKPLDGSFGRGVTTNIETIEELRHAILYAKKFSDQFIIERFVKGDEYRLYVVNQKVVGAIKRIPANVVGDGFHTVKELIEIKNELRSSNPRLISCLIKVDQQINSYIQKQGFNLNDVLDKGQQLYLTNKSNISIGGDPISVFEQLNGCVHEVAVKAIQAIPGLIHGAVDLIFEDNELLKVEDIHVLEINPTAQIGSLVFPIYGKAKDVPAAIIDFYFPETIGSNTDKDKLYFDLSDVLYPLISNTAKVSTVSSMPIGRIHVKKFKVHGEVQRIDYHRGLRKAAFEYKLNGMVVKGENNSIEVIVAGTDKERVEQFEYEIRNDPERSHVEYVYESSYTHPVKVGFEIKNDIKTQLELYKQYKNEYDQAELKLRNLQKENKKISTSTSWKLTYPIRLIGDLIKKYKRS